MPLSPVPAGRNTRQILHVCATLHGIISPVQKANNRILLADEVIWHPSGHSLGSLADFACLSVSTAGADKGCNLHIGEGDRLPHCPVSRQLLGDGVVADIRSASLAERKDDRQPLLIVEQAYTKIVYQKSWITQKLVRVACPREVRLERASSRDLCCYIP